VKVIGIIPARYHSTRFPGKPLADLAGKPMIQWVYERALHARSLSEVVVATDDERIYQSVRRFGGRVAMTSPDAPTGTDRVAEVAQHSDAEIVVNIQGDEPLIEPDAIDAAVEPVMNNGQIQVSTLVKRIDDAADLTNPNVVKVVLDKDGFALYFSRSPIPFCRDLPEGPQWIDRLDYYRHVGLYVYRKAFLLQFVRWKKASLEEAEQLEQLRILEKGFRIKAVKTHYAAMCVDTPEDLLRVREALRARRVA